MDDLCDKSREFIRSALANATAPPPEFPRVNAYACKKCGHITHTVDVADGTATMVLPCMAHTQSKIVLVDGAKASVCSGEMFSTFYSVDFETFDLRDIEFEWRFATLPEYQRYKAKGQALADHVADGGLVLHPRKNRDAPMFTHGGFWVRPDGARLSDGEAEGLQTGLQTLKEVVRLDIEKTKRKAHQKMLERHKAQAKRKAKRKGQGK